MTTTLLQPVKQRIKYFDLLKGVAIFLVVMGHSLTMCVREIDSAVLFKLIGEIHMPLFFFISGYLTYKVAFKHPNLTKRFKQLIIPFIVVSSLWVWYFPHSGLKSPLTSTFYGLYTDGWKNGYWFTLCLFEIFLIYACIAPFLKKFDSAIAQIGICTSTYLALAIITVFAPEPINSIIGLQLLTSFLPVFLIGVLAHKYKDFYESITNGNYWFIIGILLFVFSWYYLSYSWEFPTLPEWSKFIARPIEHIGLVIVAVTLIIPWSNKEYDTSSKPSYIARYFNYLGQESLGIYLLHYFFLFPMTALQTPMRELNLSITPLFVFSATVAFCVIAITLFVNYVIKRNSFLSTLLIGK